MRNFNIVSAGRHQNETIEYMAMFQNPEHHLRYLKPWPKPLRCNALRTAGPSTWSSMPGKGDNSAIGVDTMNAEAFKRRFRKMKDMSGQVQ
jgi:hypothetical protein